MQERLASPRYPSIGVYLLMTGFTENSAMALVPKNVRLSRSGLPKLDFLVRLKDRISIGNSISGSALLS